MLALLSNAPFGLLSVADAVSRHDPYYLVTRDHQQLLVRVGKRELESRELEEQVSGQAFTIGQDRFRRATRVR
ncbi:hypothetical protein [Kytococcus aerolatus]|uniref:hypothetical protein n=1 Tax=Kytococcus aerolatus TaxID=592308 RepID=UPI0013582CA5|nr:hypothetical protein [Kytococcus aerolatus]